MKCFLSNAEQGKDACYHGVWDCAEVPDLYSRLGKRNERPKDWKGNESVFTDDIFVYNENLKESADLFLGFTEG